VGWRSQLKVLGGLRDLRYVFGATVVSNLGDGIVTVALAWAVLDLTHSPTDLGVILAARIVAQVGVILLGGVVADRLSRRRVMMAADLIRLVGQAGIGVLLLTKSADLAELVASQVILGAASAFFQPAASGLLPAVAGEHKQEANAMLGIAQATSSIAGPAIGALLVVAVGGAWGLLADSLSYGLSALSLSQVSLAAGAAVIRNEGATNSLLADLRGGFSAVRSRTWVVAIIVGFGFVNALASTWGVFGPLATRRWYDGAPAFALLSVIGSVGALGAGVLMLRFTPRRPLRFGVLCCVPTVIAPVLLAFRLPLAVIAPLSLFTGLGPMLFNTLWWTALQEHVPAHLIGRVISYDYAGSFLLMPLGTALAGPLASGIGLKSGLLVCNGVALGLMALTLLVPDVRNLATSKPQADIVSP
jgi:hypothetical protein